MNTHPQKLELVSDDTLRIEWSDGQRRDYKVRELREKCPCASCREKRRGETPSENPLQVLSLAETLPARIDSMRPVGNYAYNIRFQDGHDTGIYTLELLRELGCDASAAEGTA